MSEGPGAVPHRIVANLDGAETVRIAVAGLVRDRLRARPFAGAWSTLEVICHLADSEAVLADRIKRVLDEDRPSVPFADPALYAAALG